MGRAVRSPPRDAMLSRTAGRTRLGCFGLHQALDQLGAVVRPLVVSGVLFLGNDYRAAFAVLLEPALVSISLLLAARVSLPRPHDIDLAPPALETEGLDPTFRVYLVAVAFIAAGYTDCALIAYHFGTAAVMPATWIPIVYAIAMTVISTTAAPLVFLGGFSRPSSARCAGGSAPAPRIGNAHDDRTAGTPGAERDRLRIFNAVYGVAWFAGSVLLGILYDPSIAGVVIASDGAAGGDVAAPALVGLPTRRVIGIAPTPAIP